MTWANFYLICFAVGFAFSFLSFVAGGLRWHLHLPHFHVHAGPHMHAGHGPGAGNAPAGAARGASSGMSPFNFVTVTAFLAWFGGAGYLLTRYSSVVFAVGLVLSMIVGLAGASIVFVFMTRVLISHSEFLDPADFDMVGVIGRISVPIRESGTGELIYSQAGTRRSCGARAEDGAAITKETEVVVTRYEKGIAYVRKWEEML